MIKIVLTTPKPKVKKDRRRTATCKICGGKIERPTLKTAWSHYQSMLDNQHEAKPFPLPNSL